MTEEFKIGLIWANKSKTNGIWAISLALAAWLLTFPETQVFAMFYIVTTLMVVVAVSALTNRPFEITDLGWVFASEDIKKNVKVVVIATIVSMALLLIVSHSTQTYAPYAPNFQGMEVAGLTTGTETDIILNTFMVSTAEENFFRGFMLGELQGFGFWPANLIQAGFFSIFHMNAYGGAGAGPLVYIQVWALGIIYGLLARQFGLLAPWAAHATWNNILKVMVYGLTNATLIGAGVSIVLLVIAIYVYTTQKGEA